MPLRLKEGSLAIWLNHFLTHSLKGARRINRSEFCSQSHLVVAHSDRRLDVTSHSSHAATANRLHWSLDKRASPRHTILD